MIKINIRKLEKLMTKQLCKEYQKDINPFVVIDTVRIVQTTDVKFNYYYCIEGRYGISKGDTIKQNFFTLDYINKDVPYKMIVGMFLHVFNSGGEII